MGNESTSPVGSTFFWTTKSMDLELAVRVNVELVTSINLAHQQKELASTFPYVGGMYANVSLQATTSPRAVVRERTDCLFTH